MLDSVKNDPDKDPLGSFTRKSQNKSEAEDVKSYCEHCDKTFVNNKGLKIHNGKVHSVKIAPVSTLNNMRGNKRQWESETICEGCGIEFKDIEGLGTHIGKCPKRHKSSPVETQNKQLHAKKMSFI